MKEAHRHKLIDYVPGEKNFKFTDDGKLSEQQKKALEFIRTNVLEKYGSTGVQEVLDKAIFELLKYIAIFLYLERKFLKKQSAKSLNIDMKVSVIK